jgi:hypothetical protein
MYMIPPSDILTAGLETICYGFTAIAAVVSYVLMWR